MVTHKPNLSTVPHVAAANPEVRKACRGGFVLIFQAQIQNRQSVIDVVTSIISYVSI